MDLGDRPMHVRARRHLVFGWWSLLTFLLLGIVLEYFLGFRVDWYVNVASETRRLMFRLAHAHGTLLSLVHIAFGLTVAVVDPPENRARRVASGCLFAASCLVPGGFLLGGAVTFDADPGPGILLLPVGAVLLVIAVFLAARIAAARSQN